MKRINLKRSWVGIGILVGLIDWGIYLTVKSYNLSRERNDTPKSNLDYSK